jgi:hypothetical protein
VAESVREKEGGRQVVPRPGGRWRALRFAAIAACLLASVSSIAHGRVATPSTLLLRGVDLHSLWDGSTDSDMDRELDLARGAHSNAVRIDVGWATLEGEGPGTMDPGYTSRMDRFLRGAASRGMAVIATLWETPCWASSAPAALRDGCRGAWWDRHVGEYPPTDPSGYAQIAAWMATRYGSSLAALEVWNEPDSAANGFWVSPHAAADYAALLRPTYAAVKHANPAVQVIAGALSSPDPRFLQQLYANGIRGFYDGISVHVYSGDLGPDQGAGTRQNAFSGGLPSVRQLQQKVGDSAPLWVTEFGWTTAVSPSSHVTEQQQAAYVARAVVILGSLPYVHGGIVYNLRDTGVDPNAVEDNFGLVRRDYVLKPAYGALTREFAR